MKLKFSLPNGNEIDLLGNGPDDMEYICLVCGEFKTPISELLDIYQHETNRFQRQSISDEISDQSYFFAGEIGNYDEDLQQMISWDELGEQIYSRLIQYTNESALAEKINRLYTQFCKEHEHQPHFAECAIKWEDTQETVEVRIFLSSDVYEDIDDEIFYYCDGLNDLIALVHQGMEDFTIIQCFGFDFYPHLLNE